MEESEENVDEMREILIHIDYLRKDIMQTGDRHLKFLNELFDAYKKRDMQIDRMDMKVKYMKAERDGLQYRRDKAFRELCDLQVDRRRMMGIIGRMTDKMGAQYMAKVEVNEPRREIHEVIENTLEMWSTKPFGVPKRGQSICDPKMRKENEFRVTQLLKELDIKQKSILKLFEIKDKEEAKSKYRAQQWQVHGKLNHALELIILFTKESQEDAGEIKYKLKETLREIADVDRLIREQEQSLLKERREAMQVDGRLKTVRRDYEKICPQIVNGKEHELSEELKELMQMLEERDSLIAELLEEYYKAIMDEEFEDLDEIEAQLQDELRECRWKKDAYVKVSETLFRIKGTLVELTMDRERLVVRCLKGHSEDSVGRGYIEKMSLKEFLFN